MLLVLALGLSWKFWPTAPTGEAAKDGTLKTNVAPSPAVIETPKATPAPVREGATDADPAQKKQIEIANMRNEMEQSLAQVRETIDAEEAKHPEQRAALEAQFVSIRESLESEIASAQGPATDWGVLEFTEGVPVQKTTTDGQIYELVPTREADGWIRVVFNTAAAASEGNPKGMTSQTRSIPGSPMTVRIGNGEIKFTAKWRASTPAQTNSTSTVKPSP